VAFFAEQTGLSRGTGSTAEDIEACPSNMPLIVCFQQSFLIDKGGFMKANSLDATKSKVEGVATI